jgi:hypothetical protein
MWGCEGSLCPKKLLDVSGSGFVEARRYIMVLEPTLAVFTGVCVAVAHAWCAWLEWT